ncbi:MAG: hypothetical protein EP329_08650 [Deltaproteobacteria bacterium]|nr:MAG: hypothetical protein EP329_08650 [Deltaproteobacteria bacterium]
MEQLSNIDEIRAYHAKLMEALRRTRWPPMTYMLIPSVLKSADQFVSELASYEGEEADEVARMRVEVREARASFKRLR